MIATTGSGTELCIGDAAYTRAIWEHAKVSSRLPDGQAADVEVWYRTLTDLKAHSPAKVHFCHDAS